MTTKFIGDVSVTRVEEMCGPGFTPDHLFPNWDPAFLEEHRRWMVPTCFDVEQHRFIASIHSWLVKTKHHTILVDCCAGNDKNRPAFERFNMLKTPYLHRLKAAGAHPEEIDFVMCTHLHVDHCGWNTQLSDGRWKPTFPNAKYIFARKELEYWESLEGRSQAFNANVWEDSVLPIISAGLDVAVDHGWSLNDEVAVEAAPGHTIGHVVVNLASKGERALFTGDVMHQPVQVYRPDWNSRFCAIPETAIATRKRLLARCAEQAITLFPAHFAGSFAGRVHARGDNFSWEFT